MRDGNGTNRPPSKTGLPVTFVRTETESGTARDKTIGVQHRPCDVTKNDRPPAPDGEYGGK